MTTEEFAQAIDAEKKRLGLDSLSDVARVAGDIHVSTISKGIRGEMPIGPTHIRALERLQKMEDGVFRENHGEYRHKGESEPEPKPFRVQVRDIMVEIPVPAEAGGWEKAKAAALEMVSAAEKKGSTQRVEDKVFADIAAAHRTSHNKPAPAPQADAV